MAHTNENTEEVKINNLPEEKPLELDQRLYQAAEFLYGASKLVEGVVDLGSTQDKLLDCAESILDHLENIAVKVNFSELDGIMNEIKGK